MISQVIRNNQIHKFRICWYILTIDMKTYPRIAWQSKYNLSINAWIKYRSLWSTEFKLKIRLTFEDRIQQRGNYGVVSIQQHHSVPPVPARDLFERFGVAVENANRRLFSEVHVFRNVAGRRRRGPIDVFDDVAQVLLGSLEVRMIRKFISPEVERGIFRQNDEPWNWTK